jgi:hypothetical protein
LQATKEPTVEGASLVGTGTEFGFDTGDGISALEAISDQVVAGGATAAVLAGDEQSVAYLAANGVFVAQSGSDAGPPVDPRPGLAVPSIDPFRFVWSAQSTSAASLSSFEIDGTEHPIASGLPEDATLVSLDVSRDGARLLVYLATPLGPRLVVAGIVRDQDNVPTALGVLEDLPVAATTPIDATWVDSRTVATVSQGTEIAPINLYEIGGPSSTFGQVPDAVTIVGGNGGADGLRVLRPTGEVLRPQGASWVSTGLSATFLATKQ